MNRGFTILSVLALWFGSAFELSGAHAALRVSKPGVRKEIVAVIEAQLAAFRSNDAPKAYGYAAASLRAQTPLRAFVAIVQMNYPEIWTNTHAEFGLVRDDGARATVVVHVYSQDGDAAFDYVLLRERAGWRIGSVMRHEARRRETA